MSKSQIAIVVGSTQATRIADIPVEWLDKATKFYSDIKVEIVDLRNFLLLFFNEAVSSYISSYIGVLV